ncbi:Pseudouridine kinase, partial [Pseudolycoriella hygida]
MLLNGATYQSNLQILGGGVGRNIAEGISKFDKNVHFISVVGNDENGSYLKRLLRKECRLSLITNQNECTGSYVLILDGKGDCKLIFGNTDINNSITPELIIKNEKFIKNAPVVVFDANITRDSMATILDLCRKYNIP